MPRWVYVRIIDIVINKIRVVDFMGRCRYVDARD